MGGLQRAKRWKNFCGFFRLVKWKVVFKIFPISPELFSGKPPKMEVWKIYTCEKKHIFFLIPYEPSLLPLWLYLSSVENTQKNAWMWWIGGFLVKTSRTSGWASIGMLTQDHDVITGSLDTFLGDRTSQAKSSIFRLLSRDYTPGKLTWQWTIPTMNGSCCISPTQKIGDFLHVLVASGGLEEHPQHTSPPPPPKKPMVFNDFTEAWQSLGNGTAYAVVA